MDKHIAEIGVEGWSHRLAEQWRDDEEHEVTYHLRHPEHTQGSEMELSINHHLGSGVARVSVPESYPLGVTGVRSLGRWIKAKHPEYKALTAERIGAPWKMGGPSGVRQAIAEGEVPGRVTDDPEVPMERFLERMQELDATIERFSEPPASSVNEDMLMGMESLGEFPDSERARDLKKRARDLSKAKNWTSRTESQAKTLNKEISDFSEQALEKKARKRK
jgi:hypothetical protein